VREVRFHCANGLVVLSICAPLEEHSLQKCALLAAMLLFHSCFFTHGIDQGWANLFNGRVICRKPKKQRAAKPVCSVNTNTEKNASYILNDVQ